MGKPTILMDLDSVVVDLTTPWYAAYNAEYNDDLTVERVTGWDTHKFVKPECGYCIYDYLKAPGFYRHLEMYPGALEGLREMSEFADIVIVTSAMSIPQATVDKMEWVKEYLPFLNYKNIIVTSRKDLVQGDIMVDDAPQNLADTLARHKVVYDQPWNQEVRDAERVHNWTELVAAVRRYVDAD